MTRFLVLATAAITACSNAPARDPDASATDATDASDGAQPAHGTVAPGLAWQWQLQGTVNETVLDGVAGPKLMDIDMFAATPELVARLHAKQITVICYIESGDYATSRPDAGDFAPSIVTTPLPGFPDEYFIDIRALDAPAGPTGRTLRQIMAARFDVAHAKNCDGIEPDLDDLQNYATGYSISMADQLAYNAFLIGMAHDRGMSLGLKNGIGDAPATTQEFVDRSIANGTDWAINEECNQFDECGAYAAFITTGRAVLQVEYLDNQTIGYAGASGTCAKDNAANFDGIVKDSSSSLQALPRIACR
ncbi:hypothetical protein BH11MYX1_BH11MYX1_28550 [soil metagenome]